jgi:hypothetical protein
MALTLTPLVTDNFTPTANPLNPAHWTIFSGPSPAFEACQAVTGGICEAIDLNGVSAEYNNYAFPADQYATITIGNTIPVGSGSGFYLILRAPTSGANSYFMGVIDTGTSGQLAVSCADNNITFLNQGLVAYVAGDTWTFAVVRNQVYMLHNGVLLSKGPADNSFSAGVIGIYPFTINALTDVQLKSFIAGSAVDPSAPGGGGGDVGPGFDFTFRI